MSIIPSLYRFNFDFCTFSLPDSTHLNEYILLIVLALYRFNIDFCTFSLHVPTRLNKFILGYCLYLLYNPGSNHVSPNVNMGSLGSSSHVREDCAGKAVRAYYIDIEDIC